MGYVKTSSLKDEKTETLSNDFEEPVYTNISEDHTINMAWHNVENEDANNYVLETIAGTKGLTTIAPTWFNLADTEGNISSIANSNYVNYAHQSKLSLGSIKEIFMVGLIPMTRHTRY